MTESVRTSWPIGQGIRRLLDAATVLVALAGFQLFVLSDHTDRWFAWTIDEPLSAATLGALYWASLVTVRFAMRERTWATTRGSLFGVLAFTAMTLLATLLHLGAFHLTDGPVTAVVAGWAWLVVYAIEPFAWAFLLVRMRTQPKVRIPPAVPYPAWFRVPFVGIGAGILIMGVAMFVAPGWPEEVWPWALTDLTSQALGAWWVGVGITMALTGWDDDLRAAPGPMATALVLGPLLFASLARYWGHVDWSRASSELYLAMTALLLVVGIVGLVLHAGRRVRQAGGHAGAALPNPQ
jgi:hypothetical protein